MQYCCLFFVFFNHVPVPSKCSFPLASKVMLKLPCSKVKFLFYSLVTSQCLIRLFRTQAILANLSHSWFLYITLCFSVSWLLLNYFHPHI